MYFDQPAGALLKGARQQEPLRIKDLAYCRSGDTKPLLELSAGEPHCGLLSINSKNRFFG
jgi:hypothetical protein